MMRFECMAVGTPAVAARMTQASKHTPRAQAHLDWRGTVRQAAVVTLHQAHGIGSDDYPLFPRDRRLAVTIMVYLNTRGRTDGDNYAKLVADALSGVVYHDDNQIDHWIIDVRKPLDASREGVRVIVTETFNSWEESVA